MRPGRGMVGGAALAREADVNSQGQQPQMQAGGKGRRRSVVVEDRAVIEGDTPG